MNCANKEQVRHQKLDSTFEIGLPLHSWWHLAVVCWTCGTRCLCEGQTAWECVKDRLLWWSHLVGPVHFDPQRVWKPFGCQSLDFEGAVIALARQASLIEESTPISLCRVSECAQKTSNRTISDSLSSEVSLTEAPADIATTLVRRHRRIRSIWVHLCCPYRSECRRALAHTLQSPPESHYEEHPQATL